MTQVILFTTLLYLVQIMLPNLVKSRFGEIVSERARKAVHNLRESLSVFFVLAVLSIQFDVKANSDCLDLAGAQNNLCFNLCYWVQCQTS
jgi:uncharacterized MAPEG superfamily protein